MLNGFQRIPKNLVSSLSPSAFFVHSAIVSFSINSGCYASRKTLEARSGVHSHSAFIRAIKELRDGGFIVESRKNKRREFHSVVCTEGEGVSVLNSFLFNPDYSPIQKALAIYHHLTPKATQNEAAAALKVSRWTIRRAAGVSLGLWCKSGQDGAEPDGERVQIRTTRKDLKAEKINTTCLNLFREPSAEPTNTNPEVVLFRDEQERQKTKETEEAEQMEAAKKNSLDLFGELPDHNKLFQELRQVFKNAPEEQIAQATYQAIKSRSKIRQNLFSYAYGILKQNLAKYGDRKESPTIRSIEEIRREVQKPKQSRAIKAETVKARQIADQEEAETMRANADFLNGLSPENRVIITTELNRKINPSGLKFISSDLATNGALTIPDFASVCVGFLSVHGTDMGRGDGASPAHCFPSFGSRNDGKRQ